MPDAKMDLPTGHGDQTDSATDVLAADVVAADMMQHAEQIDQAEQIDASQRPETVTLSVADPDQDSQDEAGGLLAQLEARQDEVLEALEKLDRQICDVLRDCGVTLEGDESDDSAESNVPMAA